MLVSPSVILYLIFTLLRSILVCLCECIYTGVYRLLGPLELEL